MRRHDTSAVRHVFARERAKTRAKLGLSCNNVAVREIKSKLGHHRSTEYVSPGKTGADSARSGKTGADAGKEKATAGVKPWLSLPLPRTRDGHATTYSTMCEHAIYNCTTCFTQVKMVI